MFPQKTEQLINAIETLGTLQFTTTRETPERFSVKNVASPTGPSCTITWLGHEPTFQADFSPGMTGIAFNVATDDARQTAPAAAQEFATSELAAQWILRMLALPTI